MHIQRHEASLLPLPRLHLHLLSLLRGKWLPVSQVSSQLFIFFSLHKCIFKLFFSPYTPCLHLAFLFNKTSQRSCNNDFNKACLESKKNTLVNHQHD